jgi:NADH:ubiquinone oxidoreductase subunit
MAAAPNLPNRAAGAGLPPLLYSARRIRGEFGMNLLRLVFIWWRDATPGTWLTTWLYGRKVGVDQFGNRYFQNKSGKRRWVIYNGTVEASRVPPDWHGWLHHTYKEPPTSAPFKVKTWEKAHTPNMSGTPDAYRPEGSLAGRGERAPATSDYEAWKPS